MFFRSHLIWKGLLPCLIYLLCLSFLHLSSLNLEPCLHALCTTLSGIYKHTHTLPHTQIHTQACKNCFHYYFWKFPCDSWLPTTLPSEQFIWSTAGSESDSTALGTAAAAHNTVLYLIASKQRVREGQRPRGEGDIKNSEENWEN